MTLVYFEPREQHLRRFGGKRTSSIGRASGKSI
jgi:hypothetical protein